jgi:uncharacterized protein YndB with AHSA1/START domain
MAVSRVANSDTFKLTTPSDREITLTRLFDAPRRLVFGFHGVYREIAPPERLVFTEIYDPFPDGESTVTTILTEEGGKTRMTVTSLYPSLEVRDMVLKTGMEKGAAISYDRLEEVAQSLERS